MNAVSHLEGLRGELKVNEPMRKHTSWRVGGPADHYYQPADMEDLVQFIRELPASEEICWLGLGSNLLVRDGGIRGTVIATSGALKGLIKTGDTTVRAEVGVASAKVARFSAQQNLKGAEFLAGIPGTIGGALAMNAGAFGGETWRIVEAVETINRQGEINRRTPADYKIDYRHVEGIEGVGGVEDEWFLAAHFSLSPTSSGASQATIKDLLAKRGESQPTQIPNAGSVFKNPPNDFSARLIEASGLKGACEGKACVSELHANFIVNTGGASAKEIETLITRVQVEVKNKQGVLLEPEVRIVGEAA